MLCYHTPALAYRHLRETGGLISYVVPELEARSVLESSVSALLAADEVVVPLVIDGFSFRGMMDMKAQLESLQRAAPEIAGVLVLQFRRSEVVRQGVELLREMDLPMFKTAIRRTEKMPESTFDSQPIVVYSPRSAAAQDYRRWVREYLGEELGYEEGV